MTRPAFTVEGLAVNVRTHAFDVSITVSGPVVPARAALPGALNDLYLDRHDEGRNGRGPGLAARLPRHQPPRAVQVPSWWRASDATVDLAPGGTLTFKLRATSWSARDDAVGPDHRHVSPSGTTESRTIDADARWSPEPPSRSLLERLKRGGEAA